MCGIAGIYRRTDKHVEALDVLAEELLYGIEPRGTDAAGYFAIEPGGDFWMQKEAITASVFNRVRRQIPEVVRTVLLHTRFATTGDQHSARDAHPVVNGDYVAIHNGTIWNADELFKVFELKRHAQVDSEIIPALCQWAGWDQLEDAISVMRGGAATAVVDMTRPNDLFLARVEMWPLVYVVLPDLLIWASTGEALKNAWNRTYGYPLLSDQLRFLGDGRGLRINGTDIKEVEVEYEKYVRPITTTTYSSTYSGYRSGKQKKKDKKRRRRGKNRKAGERTFSNGNGGGELIALPKPLGSTYTEYDDEQMTIDALDEELLVSSEFDTMTDDQIIDTLVRNGMDRAEAENYILGAVWIDDGEIKGHTNHYMSPATRAFYSLDD